MQRAEREPCLGHARARFAVAEQPLRFPGDGGRIRHADCGARSHRAFRSLGEGVIVTDSRGMVRLMNEAAAKFTGWTGREAAGKPLAEVYKVRG